MTENRNRNLDDRLTRIHATIEGRVQGVGFRAFAQRNAVNLKLSGWVRNRWNGKVEVVAEGPQDSLSKFIKIIERGPFTGTTRNVIVDWNEPSGEFKNFQIRMSG